MACGNEVSQPLSGVWIDLVVVSSHNQSPMIQSARSAHLFALARHRFASHARVESGNLFVQRSQTGA